jgi:hypothetical protein
MKAKTFSLSFLFFIFSVALATNYYSGSSYFYNFPSCQNLNITMTCSNKIDSGEFYFSPNCYLVEVQPYINKWVCNCWSGYKLNFTINPASNNTCDIYMVYTQTIELPEKREIYIHYSETPIIYNTTLNQTINQTIIEKEKITPYIPEEVNQTINELSRQLEEQKEISKERLDVIFHLMNKIENLEKEAKFWKIIGLVLVSLVVFSLVGYVVWVKVWKFKI